jgi:hypothetical protein
MYITSTEFRTALGAFYSTWQSVEITMDWAIGQFLKMPDEETHLLTGGMEFGRKAILLRTLVSRSDRKNKGEIIKHLSFIQNGSKRNIFAHSFCRSPNDGVIFVQRSNHGVYKATEHAFSRAEFEAHVNKFVETAQAFERELAMTRESIEKFAAAAIMAK